MASEVHRPDEVIPPVSRDSGDRLSQVKPAFTFLILFGSLVALVVAVVLSATPAEQKYETFSDTALGMSIEYPEDWSIATATAGTREYGTDRFVTLSRGTERVVVGLDVDATWCDSVDRYDIDVIEVSGKKGEDHRCYNDNKLVTIVRHFESAKSGHSYTVMSESVRDAEDTTHIVESFRFLP